MLFGNGQDDVIGTAQRDEAAELLFELIDRIGPIEEAQRDLDTAVASIAVDGESRAIRAPV